MSETHSKARLLGLVRAFQRNVVNIEFERSNLHVDVINGAQIGPGATALTRILFSDRRGRWEIFPPCLSRLCEIRRIRTTSSRRRRRMILCPRMIRFRPTIPCHPTIPCYRSPVPGVTRFRRLILFQIDFHSYPVFVRILPALPLRLLSVRRFVRRDLVPSCPTIRDPASWFHSIHRYFLIRFHFPLFHPFGLHSEMRRRRTRVFLRPSTCTHTPAVYS